MIIHSSKSVLVKQNRQQGAALIISLIILVIMTIIGVSSIQNTTLEERMAGNMRDQNLAFQAAETALRYAEQYYIETQLTDDATIQTEFSGGVGLYDQDTAEPDLAALFRNEGDVWAQAKVYEEGDEELTDVASPPRYLIRWIATQEFGPQDPTIRNADDIGSASGQVYIFRITARGTGASDQSQVILRTYYGKAL
jgi:type IV pilus assembly protein PilX